ncbi:MAG: hypothetical protein IJQ37_00990 [Clostridia bacterium]|nr:hypothetical protein [Clostridia bacterium]
MKILKRILGLALAASMIACAVLVLASCSEQERLEKESREYLKEKYGKTDFELVSYTQNKTTNGWYVANVRSKSDGVEFRMFISSVRKTDSYGVELVNGNMQKALMDGPFAANKDRIARVRWLGEFEDGYENHTFRSMDITKKYDFSDIKTLDLVELKDCAVISHASNAMYEIITSLEEYGVFLDKVLFTFDVGSFKYKVKCDYEFVSEFSKQEFVQYVYTMNEEAKKNNPVGFISWEFVTPTEETTD